MTLDPQSLIQLRERIALAKGFSPDERTLMLDARWTDSHDKAAKFISVRCGLDLGIFERACLVHEMWFANYDRDKDGGDVGTLPPPSERADRREMLMMVCVDRDRFRIGHWEILRPHPRKKPTLGEFTIPQADELMSFSAAFRGLLRNDGTRQ